ncbi:hypothetical protein [Cryobacterium zhongshanensis]|uniref:Uncharacterized protein n=1 Tax=Cryobacterium zhongshanensis TaxID=2928153 RepID=A0AA41QZ95_9MICO|nr:hypothetical protein [Cryobacterium zhongshanensis]MCI4659598.1 hypothetical protein [Cryobacterium zhongshanensis]
MAEPKRNLNIPVYEGLAPEGAFLGEDLIDAEVIDAGPNLGERVRSRATRDAEAAAGTFRNVRANGVKDAFFTQPADAAREARGAGSAGVRARQEGRARREGQARARSEQASATKQSRTARDNLHREAKLDPLAKLKLDTVQAGESYMNSLRMSGILDAGETKETQRKQLSGMHQVYASMMVLQCVQPLQQGLTGQNIASVLGMGASMWMLSPNFRTQAGSFAGQMREAIQSKIDGRGTKKDLKAQDKFDSLASKGKSDQLASRWQKRLDKIEHAERGHRLPFTAQSAAMTEVALAESAYADMRRPGADRGMVQDRYDSALSALYEFVDADGLNREDVSRSMRVIVGQRLEKDPTLANVFTELGHGRFTKSEPREVYINGTTDRATVWTGDFVDSYEDRTISKGSFRLRPVVGVSEHRMMAAETLSADMTSAKSVGELNDVLSQYVVASAVAQYPNVVDQIEDPAARGRFAKAKTMFNSMSADGLSPQEQQFAYSAAYVDAVEVVQRLNPELGNKWAAEYGDQWREKVAESMKAYNDMGAQAEHPKSGKPASETHFSSTPNAHRNSAGNAQSSSDTVEAEPADDDYAHYMDFTVDDGFVMPKDASEEGEVIDGEFIDDPALESGRARETIVDGVRSTSPQSDYERGVELKSTASRIRRARVNQHYNEIETGGITGIGSDAAEPLQDVDFELG